MTDNKIRILAIGAATQDVYLAGKILTAKRDVRTHDYVEQFPLGAKLELAEVHFDTGGGATNAAVTFARQGFKVGFIGKIGHDPAGAEIMSVLRREGVATDHVAYDTKLATGYATLLLAPNGERTILAYRGASSNLKADDFAIRNLDADWMYISSLAGNIDLLKRMLNHANNRGIQVGFNPGGAELAQLKKLKPLLPLVDVVIANHEEMADLFGGESINHILMAASRVCKFAVLTDGAQGSYATDGNRLYRAGQYQRVKVIDRTGAGDAFGSGFVTAIARGQSIEDALTLASANSTSVVQKIGAKPGILKTSQIKRMKVKVEPL